MQRGASRRASALQSRNSTAAFADAAEQADAGVDLTELFKRTLQADLFAAGKATAVEERRSHLESVAITGEAFAAYARAMSSLAASTFGRGGVGCGLEIE